VQGAIAWTTGPHVDRVEAVLGELRDELGSQSEVAVVEDDGTLRVLGSDQGARVSVFFGSGITSYEWVYGVPPGRVPNLAGALGGGGTTTCSTC
jgi:hypothetical protein